MSNKDCFAYCTETRCKILTELVCSHSNCKFYKTQRQYHIDLEKYPPIDYAQYKDTGERVFLERREI